MIDANPDLQAVNIHKERFGYMVNDTICEVGKQAWRDSDEARYNDYVLFKSVKVNTDSILQNTADPPETDESDVVTEAEAA